MISNRNLSQALRDAMQEFKKRYYKDHLDEPDWDHKTAHPIEEMTMIETFELMKNITEWLQTHRGIEIPTPKIEPRKNGTLCLFWKEPNGLTLQIVVEKKNIGSCEFYYCGGIQNPISEKTTYSLPIFQSNKKYHKMNEYKQLDLVTLFEKAKNLS